MGSESRLDMSKLVCAGHSMGGATALKAAEKDNRVKLVLTLDPWLCPLSKHILPSVDKPCHMQNTYCWHDQVA